MQKFRQQGFEKRMDMYAVIDTNVFVSAFITKNDSAATRKVYEYVISGKIVPLYNDEILKEYRDVLSRPKFHLEKSDVDDLILLVLTQGISATRVVFEGEMIDPKDRVFYEISLSVEGSLLVTGNLRHFPITTKVVSPAEMVRLIEMEDQPQAEA